MNVRDSEVIAGLLVADGYRLTDNPEEADIIIFNTCSVRQHAEDKVWSEIGRYKKGQSPAGTVPIIGVIGCMAKNYAEEVFKKAPRVDFVVGPQDIDKIPEILKKFPEKKGQSLKSGDSPFFEIKIWETQADKRPEEIYHTGFYADKEHAYVVISEGCSNFCSYCVVPYVRGDLRNRRDKDILQEIEGAIAQGINKITLLGQNVNAYQCNGVNFPKLLKQVDALKGIEEFSFITSHPKDTSPDLFKAMADCARLRKYLHLPVQSGSDRILQLMNRGYTRKSYLDLAGAYRKIVKNAQLTTDIIVGFPGESEEDFSDTFNLVKEAGFDAAYIFKYSPRPHTAAANMADDITQKEKQRRHKIILDLQKAISTAKSAAICILALFWISLFGICHLSYALDLEKPKAYFLSGDYTSCISECEKILADTDYSPELDELYYLLGLSYLKEGKFLRAQDIFEIILKEFKGSRYTGDALLGLGDIYFLQEDYEKAKVYYQQLLDKKPSTSLLPQVYYRLGKCALAQGDTEQAKLYLEKSAGIESSLPDIHYTVQVGSFSNITNAQNLADKLKRDNYPAYVEEALSPTAKKTYRVRVGKLSRRQEAVILQDELARQGYPVKIYP